MIYQFHAEDGSVTEVDLPMAEAPEFGATVRVDGKTYTRHPQAPSAIRVKRDCYIKSHSQPRWSPHHKGEFDKDGKPCFSSWGEVDHISGASSENEHVEVKYEGGYR